MKILVAVNPVQRSVAVLDLAAMLARSADAELIVAAVLPVGWQPLARRTDGEWLGHLGESADVVLDHAASVLAGLKASFVQRSAKSAHRGIVDLIEEHSPDIVVVGSSSSGAIGRIAIGSVNGALLHASPVPVAIAPRGFRAGASVRIRRLTAAYGGSDAARDLVISAARVAADIGSRLRLASFAVGPEGSVTAGVGLEAERDIAEEWIRMMDESVDEVLSEVSEMVGAPQLDDAVVGVGDSWAHAMDDVTWTPEDVLVIGSSSLGPVARVFVGSNATKVLRSSPVPAIVVPRGGLR